MRAEAERMEREEELEKVRQAERQKKLDEAAAKQRAREKEIEEREVRPFTLQCYLHSHLMPLAQSTWHSCCVTRDGICTAQQGTLPMLSCPCAFFSNTSCAVPSTRACGLD